MSRRYVRLVAVMLCLGAATPSVAWEADVHYGLTYWLAVQAGFSTEEAKQIADGDESLDDGSYWPATYAVPWAMLKSDAGAAESVRDNHFPSEGKLPSPPVDRTVRPGSDAAYRAVDRILQEEKPYREQLRNFGKALHPLQDSWSHQGVPDSPFRPLIRVRPDYSFGHPADRSGWSKHDADLTYLHPCDLSATAIATYEAMVSLRKRQHPKSKVEPKPWRELRQPVELFATARTKEEKIAWLQRAGVPGLDVVGAISLPGSAPHRFLGPRMMTLRPPDQPQKADPDLPPNAWRQINELRDQLRNAWRKKDTNALVSLVEWPVLKQQFPGLGMEREDVIRWCNKFVNMWWIEDHGAVNAAGHCDPTHVGFASLPESPQAEGIFKARDVTPDVDMLPPELIRVDRDTLGLEGIQGDPYAIAFQAETPHDTVVMVLADVGGQWRIVRMFWVIV